MNNIKNDFSYGSLVFKIDKNIIYYLIIKQKMAHYGFPKGHKESNETDIETAKREVLEETGIYINIYEDYYFTNSYYPNINTFKKVKYYLSEAINYNYKKQDEEIDEIFWLDYNQALKIITFENDKKMLKHFNNILIKNKTI